jgi:hypothetical protein
VWNTTSTPPRASAKPGTFCMSPTTSSAPASPSWRCAFSFERTSARTEWPSARKVRTRLLPNSPVAPVTNVIMTIASAPKAHI